MAWWWLVLVPYVVLCGIGLSALFASMWLPIDGRGLPKWMRRKEDR